MVALVLGWGFDSLPRPQQGSNMPDRTKQRLTPDAQGDADDFEYDYSCGGCSCHIDPPCGYCVHPGNPRNLEEDDEAWEDDPDY